MTFSQRHGHKPVRQALQVESMDAVLRHGLWDAINENFCDHILAPQGPYNVSVPDVPGPLLPAMRELWAKHLRNAWDTISEAPANSYVAGLRYYCLNCEWNELYDVLECFAAQLPDPFPDRLMRACNTVLQEEAAGYRFVANRIAPITDEQEITAIEQGLADADPLTGVRVHLVTAVDMMAKRPHPDYRNSVKESISAVESICCRYEGKSSVKLSQVLNRIETAGHLHPVLRRAFDNLFGYSSQEEGVRHMMLEEDVVDRAEAQFMLVACSAFVSYLVAKVAGTDIDLSKSPV